MIRSIKPKELGQARALIWDTFLADIAPDYSAQGIASFEAYLKEDLLTLQIKSGRLCFYGYFVGNTLCGVVALRGSHISLLFVSRETKGQGYGTKLIQHAVMQCQNQGDYRLTVHASPHAVGFYQHCGFVPTDVEQLVDGIRYTPMQYVFETITLRAHHGMCIQNYCGKGYSETFAAQMQSLCDQFATHPNQQVRLVQQEDVLCHACPHYQDGCVSGQKVAALDSGVMQGCGFTCNQVMTVETLFAEVQQKLFQTGVWDEICQSCQWYEICKPLVEKRSETK